MVKCKILKQIKRQVYLQVANHPTELETADLVSDQLTGPVQRLIIDHVWCQVYTQLREDLNDQFKG